MNVVRTSKRLGLTMLTVPMSEADFWAMTLDAPEGYVAGWPMDDGIHLAVKSGSLKGFLAAMKTAKKASQIETDTSLWVVAKATPETPWLSRFQTGRFQ